jgi:hypothetical protein
VKAWHIIFTLAAVIMLTTAVEAGPVVLLKVNEPPAAWSEIGVGEKLALRLSRDPALRVVSVGDTDDHLPPFPNDQYNVDSLVDWGLAAGGQYLLLVDVHHERLERRKTWQLPLFFHKYVTMGVIDGEVRLVDLVRGELVLAEPFRQEKEARRIFQGSPDDDIGDPDLHVPAPGKQVFFDRLEHKLCDELLESTGLMQRGKNGE